MGALDDLIAPQKKTSALDALLTPDTPQHTPWGEIADDTANSIISKGIGGIVGMAGLPGDIEHAGNQALEYLRPDVKTTDYLPSSTDTENWVKSKIGDYSYTPKTGAGEIVGTVAGMAPAALGGGSGVLRPAAQVLGAGLASKALGDLGREVSPELGMAGDIAGAVIGAGRMSKPEILGKAPVITAADEAASAANMVTSPGTQAVKRVSQDAYKAAEDAGVGIKPDSFLNFTASLSRDKVLNNLQLDPSKHPGLDKMVQTIKGYIRQGIPDEMAALTGTTPRQPGPVSLGGFDNLRQIVLKATRSADPDERRVAGHIIDRMDAYFNNLKPSDVTGDIRTAQSAIKTARENWRIFRKSEDIDKIMEVAKDRAGQFSVSGNENAIRTGFRQLSVQINKDPRVRARYTQDEIKVIRQLSRGWQPRDFVRGVGAVLNNRIVQGIGLGGVGAASYQEGGLSPEATATAAILWLAGKGARSVSGAMAANRANTLSRLIRSGGQMSSVPSVTLPIAGEVRALPITAGIATANQDNQ